MKKTLMAEKKAKQMSNPAVKKLLMTYSPEMSGLTAFHLKKKKKRGKIYVCFTDMKVRKRTKLVFEAFIEAWQILSILVFYPSTLVLFNGLEILTSI